MKYQIELLVNWTNPLTALIFRASPAAAKCSNTGKLLRIYPEFLEHFAAKSLSSGSIC